MNKSEIIIGGIRAAKFKLIQILDKYFLNGIMILSHESEYSDQPDHMNRYVMRKKDYVYKYKIENLKQYGQKIVWAGYRGKFDKIYLDKLRAIWSENEIKLK